ncbi:MAG: restriction endonuclease [Thaumarchaeota archaeon]|nr:restriction endonuclease [Nitrososphaerota archaeon]
MAPSGFRRPPSESRLQSLIEGSSTSASFEEEVVRATFDLGPRGADLDPVTLRAIVACRMGTPADIVAKFVDWKGFESFCGGILRSVGFDVRQNILLRKPPGQIDLLARRDGVALLVDCKQWGAGGSPSALRKAAEAQGRRADRLRLTLDAIEPMAIVIVSLRDDQVRFVNGAAIVPVHTLADFSSNLSQFAEFLELR